MNKPDKKTALNAVKEAGIWIIGCILYATAVNGFALPNSIAQSGMTGAGVILHKLFGWPIGLVGFALNVPLLILMYIFISKNTIMFRVDQSPKYQR